MLPLAPFLNNQFLSGGFVLMVTGAAMALLRNLPGEVWAKIKSQCMIAVSVNQGDPLFDWITLWLNEHPYSRKARWLKAETLDSDYYGEDTDRRMLPKIIFSPNRGEHFLFYQKKFVWLTRAKIDKETPGTGTQKTETGSPSLLFSPEQYIFRTFGRKQAIIRRLLDDVLELTRKEREEKVAVYTCQWGSWDKLFAYETRPLDSVILPYGVKEGLIDDLRNFLSDRAWYVTRGIPYRRGYLFHGPPGNGKTSCISAIAGHMKLNLYMLNLSDRSLDDAALASLVRRVRLNSILLLEDVDAAMVSRENVNKGDDEEKKRSGVTLSGLLNVLDGVLTPDGLMVIMTTNYPQRLDPALIRPGRADKRVPFENATEEQKRAAFRWFYPNHCIEAEDRFAASLNGHTSMAEVQQRLLEMREPDSASTLDLKRQDSLA